VNKRHKEIVLGLLVVVVWGGIGYKVISFLGEDSPNEVLTQFFAYEKSGISVSKNMFSIDANYADPFLKSMEVESLEPYTEPSPEFQPAEYSSFSVIKWPEIGFSGIIQTSDKTKKFGMVKVFGNDYFIKEQDTIMGIRVLAIYRDSIKLEYSDSIKVYSTQK